MSAGEIKQYDIGDKVRMSSAITGNTGSAADPGALVLKYRKPNGTVVTLTYGVGSEITRDSLGNYHADIIVDQAGTWTYRFISTGNAAGAEESFFAVRRSDLA